jgi:hypothetical protein
MAFKTAGVIGAGAWGTALAVSAAARSNAFRSQPRIICSASTWPKSARSNAFTLIPLIVRLSGAPASENITSMIRSRAFASGANSMAAPMISGRPMCNGASPSRARCRNISQPYSRTAVSAVRRT